MPSLTRSLTEHLFMAATFCDLSGLPFSQAWNMHLSSMAFWSESPFQPNR